MRPVPVVYLASYTLSALGNSIAGIVLPLVVLQATGSALAAGTVAAATILPAVLAGLFMGVVIDRINRRTSSIITDLVSAAAMAALPVVDMITGLSVGWFVLFGVIGAIGDVPGITAREALLPGILRHGTLGAERLTGTREALGAVAILVGPAVAGLLVTLWAGSAALWITAATSLSAALLTLAIPHRVGALPEDPASPAATATHAWSELREGWTEMLSNGFVRVTTLLTVVGVLAIGGLQGIVLPLYFTAVDRPGMIGLVLSALAGGSLVGGGIYALAGSRGTRRSWFVVGVAGNIVGVAMIATLLSVGMLLAGAFVLGLAFGLYGALIGVLSLERIPDRQRGRILGTQNTAVTAASPLGILVAGAVTEAAGIHPALLVLSAVWAVGLLVALAAPSMRDLEPPGGRDPRAVRP